MLIGFANIWNSEWYNRSASIVSSQNCLSKKRVEEKTILCPEIANYGIICYIHNGKILGPTYFLNILLWKIIFYVSVHRNMGEILPEHISVPIYNYLNRHNLRMLNKDYDSEIKQVFFGKVLIIY